MRARAAAHGCRRWADHRATRPLDGDAVGVIVDDVTVKRASSTTLTARKAERVVQLAQRTGMPVLFVGEAGGARLPETLRGDVFASEPIYPWLFDPAKPPLVTAIVGDSYGGSSFVAAMSDIVGDAARVGARADVAARHRHCHRRAGDRRGAGWGQGRCREDRSWSTSWSTTRPTLDAVLRKAMRFFTCPQDDARRGRTSTCGHSFPSKTPRSTTSWRS